MIKVSCLTLAKLEALRKAINAKSLDGAIKRVLTERHQRMLEAIFEMNKKIVNPFKKRIAVRTILKNKPLRSRVFDGTL
jgi:ferritin-like metal-binding protein YciE